MYNLVPVPERPSQAIGILMGEALRGLALLLIVCDVGARGLIKRGIGIEAQCYYSANKACTIDTAGNPGTHNCSVAFFPQILDHFHFDSNATTFPQRYFVYDRWWKRGGPIFFYCGNEASVELYVNATGLMWENAEQLGAGCRAIHFMPHAPLPPLWQARCSSSPSIAITACRSRLAARRSRLRTSSG